MDANKKFSGASSIRKYSLIAGASSSFIYYGAQLISVPFFEGFNWRVTSASDLGSNMSSFPTLLNVGALLCGIAFIAGTYGLFEKLLAEKTPKLVVAAFSLAATLAGVSNIWAGFYPLPSELHEKNPGTVGLLLLPLVFFVFSFWIKAKKIRTYMRLNFCLFILLALIFSGALPITGYNGALQRILAATVFIPFSVLCYKFAKIPDQL